MCTLTLTNTFLMLHVFGMLISNYLIEGATINERTQVCWEYACETGDCIAFEKSCDGNINLSPADGMCILPPYPDHGWYHAPMGLKPGDAVRNVSLTFSCDLGFRLNGKSSPSCVNGTWLAELPTCTNQCKPLKSSSVDFKCYKPSSTVEISCTLPQDNNSHAKATCKDSYYLDPAPKHLSCINGSWDYMPYCIQECGTVAPEGQTLIINGMEAEINEFPWHVGLYDKTSTPIQICGGSIFTPKLVITAAHCVYKDHAGLYPASSFAVAAGKLYRRWNSPRDDEKIVQKIDVMKIEVPERYKGLSNAFMADIAVLVLERSFVFSSLVRPVCIQFDSKPHLNGQFGKVAGWGLTAEDGHSSQILRTVTLPYVSFKECYDNSKESFQPLIIDDKICAGYKNGTALCKGDSGGGLVFSRQKNDRNLYFLHGIVSNSARNKALTSCSAFAYTAFTNTFKHQEWLEDICLKEWGCENGGCISLEKRCSGETKYCTDGSDNAAEFCSNMKLSTSKSRCTLPPYPSRGYYNTTLGHKPGDVVPYTTLIYYCDENYSLHGEGSRACIMGNWLTDMPSCKRKCKPLTSVSVDFKCYKQHSNLEISCDSPQDTNSRAKATCKYTYQPESSLRDMTCIDGSWDFMPFCNEECGTVAPQGQKLVINGEASKTSEFPWHVGLYDKTFDPKLQICGGTIFSPKMVVTAAHCVYKENVGVIPASTLTVAAGKMYKSWNDRRDDEKYVQKRDVSEIEIPERFKGFFSSYASDIAVLILEESFEFSSMVRPVCIRFDNKDNLDGQFGKVAGWGLTAEDGNASRILQTANLPFVSYQECYDNSTEDFRPFITSDKICAGYKNGTTFCRGNSGGGFVFSRSNNNQDHYYLYGIVSISSNNKGLTACDRSSYIGFTDLIKHREWFQDIWSRHNTIN